MRLVLVKPDGFEDLREATAAEEELMNRGSASLQRFTDSAELFRNVNEAFNSLHKACESAHGTIRQNEYTVRSCVFNFLSAFRANQLHWDRSMKLRFGRKSTEYTAYKTLEKSVLANCPEYRLTNAMRHYYEHCGELVDNYSHRTANVVIPLLERETLLRKEMQLNDQDKAYIEDLPDVIELMPILSIAKAALEKLNVNSIALSIDDEQRDLGRKLADLRLILGSPNGSIAMVEYRDMYGKTIMHDEIINLQRLKMILVQIPWGILTWILGEDRYDPRC